MSAPCIVVFDISTFPMWYLMLWGALFGALTASFLCVVAERVPKSQSIRGRSNCVCGRQLKVTENVPIFGWLRVRGRSTCCGASIPVFYLYAEIFLAVVWGFAPLAGLFGSVIAAAGAAALVGAGVRRLRP